MKKLLGGTYLIEGATNVGIYTEYDRAYMIDAGGSRKALREAIKELYGKKITLLITHHHSDHIKNASYIQRMTGCEALAPLGELSMISNPILESYILFGANPPTSLRGEFFVAKPVKVKPIPEEEIPLKVVSLPGHTPFHVGYATPDGVLFSGDLFFSKSVVEKYSYPYHSSISQLRETLKRFGNLRFNLVVPSHGEPTKDPSSDIDFMMDRIDIFEKETLNILERPMFPDEIALELSRRFDLSISGGFWYLFKSFVMALLEDLESLKEISEESGKWIKGG